MAEPLDFELEIGPAGDAGYPVTARLKGGGEASGLMSWSMTGRELDAQLGALRDSVLASSATVRRLSTLDEQPVREFGQRLFEAAISNQIRLLFGSAYQQSRQQDRVLRLVLRIRPPELARLPWEYLFDRSEDTYLGLRMPLVRYPQVLEPQRPLKVSPPLNILAMVARPGDQTALDVRGEKRRLGTALAELERAGQVKLTWVRGQSWRDLRTILDKGPWHVFHFIGHGGYDAESGEGVLALAGESGGTAPLGAGALSMVLSDSSALRLVVLNACDTGRSSSLDSFSSVAGALVRRGIPAILAMQFEITDRAAIEFTRTFYEELAHRRPVDAGAMRARQAIYIAQSNSLEWGTPVLYLRSSDGQIFDFSEAGLHEQRTVQRDSQTEESDSLRKRYAEGLAAFYTERWEEAVTIFRELLAEDPDYPGASLKLEQALRQANLVASYADAIKAVSESRWKDAVEGFEAVLAADSGYQDTGQRLEEARTQQTIADLQDEARRLYEARHWAAVVRIGEQLNTIDSRSADPDGVVSEARRLLEGAKQAKLQAEQYTVALEHIDKRDWPEARAALERVQGLGTGYRDTPALIAMVDRHLSASAPAAHSSEEHLEDSSSAGVGSVAPLRERALKPLLTVMAIAAAGVLVLGGLMGAGVIRIPAPGPSGTKTTPSATSSAASPATTEKTIDVPGTQTWTDSGIDVVAGERITIEATGEVHHNPVDPAVGPDGDMRPMFGNSVLPYAAHAALIAKIDERGGPYLVGRGWVRTVDQGGRLFLGVNDNGVDNNSGKFTAKIVGSRPPVVSPAPPPGTIVKTVEVPGTQAWTDTGIDVSSGERITIEATGEVQHISTDPAVGPDGDKRPELSKYSVLPNAAHAALIAKIGDRGGPYLVGMGWIGSVDQNGRLFLGVNDKGVDNNSGKFTAKIQVVKP